MPIRIDKDRPGGAAAARREIARELQLLALVLALGGPKARAAAAIEFVGVVKETLSTPGGGAVVRGRSGAGHRRSLPGDPPAPDLGEYRRSWGWRHVGPVTRIGTPLARGPALEFGDPSRGLEARPHARPSLIRARRGMTKAAAIEYRKQTQKV